jgi:hypothetical protein
MMRIANGCVIALAVLCLILPAYFAGVRAEKARKLEANAVAVDQEMYRIAHRWGVEEEKARQAEGRLAATPAQTLELCQDYFKWGYRKRLREERDEKLQGGQAFMPPAEDKGGGDDAQVRKCQCCKECRCRVCTCRNKRVCCEQCKCRRDE